VTSSTRHLRPLLVLSIAAILAACGPNVGNAGTVPPVSGTAIPSVDPGSPDPTPGDSSSPGTSADPSGQPSGTPVTPTDSPSIAPSPSATGTTIVRAYFLLEDRAGDGPFLVPVLREVPRTKAVATAAMTSLLAGPIAKESAAAPRIVTSVPDGVTLLGLSVDGGVATVDLSREFESGGGSASVVGRLAQVVYTLTQFSNVTSVRFLLDGQPVDQFGSEGPMLDKPVTRTTYRDFLPPIFVDRAAWGAALGNPGRVAGLSNVFEATFRVKVLDGAGRSLVDQQAMADCGTGCWGRFDVSVPYTVAKAQWGTLRVYDRSAKDGTPQDIRDYPVWLTPA
jgi:sporulation and spore germination protein/immunoglobulin-like protein involved in spore germination